MKTKSWIIAAAILFTTVAQAQFVTAASVAATGDSISATWTTAAPAKGVLRYGLTSSLGKATPTETTLTTTHSATVTKLLDDTDYYYSVKAADILGQSIYAAVKVVHTQKITVTVSPSSVALSTGATQQFTATVAQSSNKSVTWSATGGTITSTGLYTAPSTAGTYTVTAKSVANTSRSDTATVTVTSPIPVAISISPKLASVQSGGSQQFSATVTGSTNQGVNFSAAPGSINTSGIYTAPTVSSDTSATVTATAQADTTKSDSASVTVLGPKVHTVTLNWSQPNMTNVTGFRVYRKLQSASSYSVLTDVPSTTYEDAAVTAGALYTYTVSAVNGNVSPPAAGPISNEVNVTIPTP